LIDSSQIHKSRPLPIIKKIIESQSLYIAILKETMVCKDDRIFGCNSFDGEVEIIFSTLKEIWDENLQPIKKVLKRGTQPDMRTDWKKAESERIANLRAWKKKRTEHKRGRQLQLEQIRSARSGDLQGYVNDRNARSEDPGASGDYQGYVNDRNARSEEREESGDYQGYVNDMNSEMFVPPLCENDKDREMLDDRLRGQSSKSYNTNAGGSDPPIRENGKDREMLDDRLRGQSSKSYKTNAGGFDPPLRENDKDREMLDYRLRRQSSKSSKSSNTSAGGPESAVTPPYGHRGKSPKRTESTKRIILPKGRVHRSYGNDSRGRDMSVPPPHGHNQGRSQKQNLSPSNKDTDVQYSSDHLLDDPQRNRHTVSIPEGGIHYDILYSDKKVPEKALQVRDSFKVIDASHGQNTGRKTAAGSGYDIDDASFWTEVRTNRNDISDESVLSDVGVKGRRADDSIGKPDMTFWEEKSGRKKGGAFRDAALEEIDRRAWYV
jgi:hypothetical protein